VNTRTSRFLAWRLAVAAVLTPLVIVGCGQSNSGSETGQSASATGAPQGGATGQAGRQAPDLIPVVIDPSLAITTDPYAQFAHNLTPLITAQCAALSWTTCNIPELTDDQAFMDQPDTFGPHAFVAPSEHLQTWNTAGHYSSGRLVAFVSVDAGPAVPATYNGLYLLAGGITCFYLQYSGGWTGFSAMPTGGVCSQTIPVGANQHRVQAAALPAPYTSHVDIPPVARFHEVKHGSVRGYPSVGTKCGPEWCTILPVPTAAAVVDTQNLRHKAWLPPNSRTSVIHGWHDVQTLAVEAGTSPGSTMRGQVEASVVASPELRGYNANGWPSGFVHAATVVMTRPPSGKYVSAWRFRGGTNLIFLKRVGRGQFQAELRHWSVVGGVPHLIRTKTLQVTYHAHNRPVPATARFLWNPGDEDVWVSCEAGCCMVSSDS
jgi:hypothetical protein